tara:strand:- start:78 stop:2006 length:1929 start_codon:yes stop_codon:yes gene_type:complete
MRILILIIFFSFKCFAKDNCKQKISSTCVKSYKKALVATKNNQYAKAFLNLENALSENKNYVDALFLYGQLKMEKGFYITAQEFFEKVIKICPLYSIEIYWLIASMAFEDGNYEKAIAYYDSYLRFINLPEDKKSLARIKIEEADFLINLYSNLVPFNPTPVLDISTKNDEYLAILSPDNEIAFFTRRLLKKEVGMLRAETVEDFMFSYLKGSKYSYGKKMPKPFNFYNNEGGASLTIDNNELFLTICQPTSTVKNCDIFYTYLKQSDSTWAPLERLDYPINSPDTWESQPSISSDGKTLFFSSIRPGGKGMADIYSVTRNNDGSWGNLKSMPFNTEKDEKSPFLHPDNQTLYFSSDGYLGVGGLDIFYVKKDTNGVFSKNITNIGYPINSQSNDLGFFVSTNGKTAYFSSDKLDGVGGYDLYRFPLYKEARPERVLFLKGDILDESGEPVVDASIEIKSIKNNKSKNFNVDSQNGRYVAMMTLEKDEDVIVTVKDSLHAFNSLYVSSSDNSFESPKHVDFNMKMMRIGDSFPINNIYFPTDSFNLNDQSKTILFSFSEFLKIHSSIKIAIHGHTDSFGDSNDNLLLSQKRAQSVHDYLIKIGVSGKKISCEGFGETKPIESNENEIGRSKNRRTEFYILEK